MAAAGFVGTTRVGDFDTGFAGSTVQVDASFETAMQLSQPMEPHATLAWWDARTLNLVTSHQTITNIQTSLEAAFGLSKERLVISRRSSGVGLVSKLPYTLT